MRQIRGSQIVMQLLPRREECLVIRLPSFAAKTLLLYLGNDGGKCTKAFQELGVVGILS